MKITIEGTPKEIADLAVEAQNRLNESICSRLFTYAKCGAKSSMSIIHSIIDDNQSSNE